MEEKDQNVNTPPQSQEPSEIEDKEKTQEKEGQASPVATVKVHKTVPMIPHDRKVTFRKKQPHDESRPEIQKQSQPTGVKYVKKDELGHEHNQEEKKAYVELKPHEKKFVYQKKGAKVERQPKMEKQVKSEKYGKGEQNERPVSLSRSIMRQGSFDLSSRPKVEQRKVKEQGGESPQDKKGKAKYIKKAAVPMNFQELEQYLRHSRNNELLHLVQIIQI